MNEERTYTELISTYNEGTREVLERVRSELNEDTIFAKMEQDYGVYDLLNFNEFNLKARLERLAFHMKDFKLKYLQELAKVEQVQDRLDKTIGEKYQALKNGEVSLTKTEIEKYYLPVDPQIVELKGLLRKQELRAEYFKAVWDAFEKLGWNIKAYIELNKGGF